MKLACATTLLFTLASSAVNAAAVLKKGDSFADMDTFLSVLHTNKEAEGSTIKSRRATKESNNNNNNNKRNLRESRVKDKAKTINSTGKKNNSGPGAVTNIVGGTPVSAGEYPWHARATLSFFGIELWYGCGGSLVTEEFVLTAAHCGYSAGNHDWQIGALCPPYGPSSSQNCGQDVEYLSPDAVYNHPGYNAATSDKDYTLVKLKNKATTIPVPMDTDATSETYPNSGKKLYPIGFGTTSSGGDSSDDLLVAETFYVPNGQCDDLYGFFGPITSNMICSGDIVNGGVDACQGDSGGPLYDADNDILVGVTSWGIGCADEDFPGVYARVSAQWNEWIKPTICDNHSNPKPCFCDGSCDDDTPTTDDGPTTDDEPTACPAGQVSLTLELMTDDYGEDITWAVIELSGGGSFDVIEAGGAKLNQDYGDNQLYTEELCLPDKCLKFVMYDEYGDGLCCEWGNGGYMVTYDGTLVVSDSFEGIDSSQPHGEPSPLTAITNIGC